MRKNLGLTTLFYTLLTPLQGLLVPYPDNPDCIAAREPTSQPDSHWSCSSCAGTDPQPLPLPLPANSYVLATGHLIPVPSMQAGIGTWWQQNIVKRIVLAGCLAGVQSLEELCACRVLCSTSASRWCCCAPNIFQHCWSLKLQWLHVFTEGKMLLWMFINRRF